MTTIKLSRMQPVILFLVVLLFLFAMAGCDQPGSRADSAADTPNSGEINISVDESFRPVMDEQVKVFETEYPGARINIHYKAEADCLRDLFRDSATRMVFVTRGLTPKEESFFKDSLNFVPRWDEVASDAIAVVVNIANKDSVFSVENLRTRLAGTSREPGRLVFDGMNATSTVRFALDSILRGKKMDTSKVGAVKNSQEVLDFVAANPDAIGLVGISWIGNPEVAAQTAMLKKVKIASLECQRCGDTPYVQPSQYNILTHRYPLVRGLYYVLKENYAGLGSGFLGFLQYERGQLIFRRSYLGPSRMGFAIRDVQINETLKTDSL